MIEVGVIEGYDKKLWSGVCGLKAGNWSRVVLQCGCVLIRQLSTSPVALE